MTARVQKRARAGVETSSGAQSRARQEGRQRGKHVVFLERELKGKVPPQKGKSMTVPSGVSKNCNQK